MKALTICQPYAHLIAHGEKRVENREWSTRHRGPLLIHAGKSLKWLRGELPTQEMVFGALVAVATLADCLHIDDINDGKHDQQWPWLRDHVHTEGTWCWVLKDVRRLGNPILWTGAQGLWNVPDQQGHGDLIALSN